jgi:hypothetical protein
MSYSARDAAADGRVGRTTIQKAAVAVGVVFLLVGVLGFVPGITSNYDSLMLATHESDAQLLGLFQVSVLHNIVHLLFGVWGLIAARTASGSRTFLVVGGIIYLVLFLYGLVVPQNSDANFVPVNGADDILHLLLAVAMIGLGLALSRRTARTGEVRP